MLKMSNWHLEQLYFWCNCFCFELRKKKIVVTLTVLSNPCCALVQIYLLHCPKRVHNNVHWRFALIHLQRLEQDFLHPHFKSSWHALAASWRVVQYGVHAELSVSLCQPHIFGGGSSGFPIIYRFSPDVPCVVRSPFHMLFRGM